MKKFLAAGAILGFLVAGLFTNRYQIINAVAPNCAQVVINQMTAPSTTATEVYYAGVLVGPAQKGKTYVVPKVIKGSWECLTADFRQPLSMFYGVQGDSDLAILIAIRDAKAQYLGQMPDGGLVYAVTIQRSAHNEIKGAYSALETGITLSWNDVQHGQFSSILGDLGIGISSAWDEINGKTQGAESVQYTFYLDNHGLVEAVM